MNLRDRERESIRAFLHYTGEEGRFTGRSVLDYGCGPQPYADLIGLYSPASYVGYDSPVHPASTVTVSVGEPGMFNQTYETIVCTQVIQYVPDVVDFLKTLCGLLVEEGGCLVITWPTNWPEVEQEDLWRFTQSGMAKLLHLSGFYEWEIRPRAFIDCDGGTFYLGHGAIAWR